MDEEHSYRMLLGILVALLLVYPLIAIANRADEPFFFFSWFVFSHVPDSVRVAHEARLLEADGRVFEQPLLFIETRGVLTEGGIHAPEYTRRTEAFAAALDGGDETRVSAAKAAIDALIVAPRATYELVELTFDPIEHWKTRAVLGERALGTF